WIGAGYKNQYEEINAFIAQVEQRDLSLLKKNYQDDLEKARLTGIASGSDFFYTALTPAHFATSSGWSQFHFGAGDFSSYSNSTYNASGWEASASAGFFGIGASGGGGPSAAKTQNKSSFNSDHTPIPFPLFQGRVGPPWMKPA